MNLEYTPHRRKREEEELYSVVSRDALDLIEEQDGTTLHRLRLASVFILLSLNTKFETTNWSQSSCLDWLGMAPNTARKVITELQALKFEDGEPILERLKDHGIFPDRKPARRNPIIIPFALKRRKNAEKGTSFIERMFHTNDRFEVKAWRLMLMVRIYSAFDEKALCCHTIMFQPLKADPDAEYEGIECALAPTTIFDTPTTSAWMFPPTLKKREAASSETIGWLAKTGLITIVRIVVADGEILYVASYGSEYWRNRVGDFQSKIRKYSADEVYTSMENYGTPVFFVGGDLFMSIAPQYQVDTNKTERARQTFELNENEVLEEYGFYH